MNSSPRGMSIVSCLFGGWSALVLAFLYLPIVLLIIYSFNRSELNIVWTGATIKWYSKLLQTIRS